MRSAVFHHTEQQERGSAAAVERVSVEVAPKKEAAQAPTLQVQHAVQMVHHTQHAVFPTEVVNLDGSRNLVLRW